MPEDPWLTHDPAHRSLRFLQQGGQTDTLQLMNNFVVYVDLGEQGATNVDLQLAGDFGLPRAKFLSVPRQHTFLQQAAPDRLGSITLSNFARARFVEETLAPKWPFWQTGRVFLTCKRCWQHPISNCAHSHGVLVCKVLLDLVSITHTKPVTLFDKDRAVAP